MAEAIQTKNLGLAVNWNNPHCMESIYQFYINLDQNKYFREREKEINRIKADDEVFKEELKKFVFSTGK